MKLLHLPAFRDLPLRHKLISIIVATSGISLLVASAAFVAYDKSTFREKMVRDVSVEADIIAMNSTAALTFEDFDSARTTLSALNKEPSVVVAALESSSFTVGHYSWLALATQPLISVNSCTYMTIYPIIDNAGM